MDEEMRFHPMKQKNKKTNPMVVECRHLEWLVEDSFFFFRHIHEVLVVSLIWEFAGQPCGNPAVCGNLCCE
jgi:predicted small integral membrane protein